MEATRNPAQEAERMTPERTPDFFIVGAPRCATTSMSRYLLDHPEVFLFNCDEPAFFGTDIHPPEESHTEDEYRDLYADAGEDQLIGEANTLYLFSETALEEIERFCGPDTKVVAHLRNPTDQMYSMHRIQISKSQEDVKNFERALALEDDRKRGERIPRSCKAPHKLFYRSIASYADQLERAFKVLGRANVHVNLFDDIQDDTHRVYRETCEFLGIDTTHEPDLEVHNQNRRIRSPKLHNLVLQPPTSLRKLGRVLVPSMIRPYIAKVVRAFNDTEAPRPPMDPELRRELSSEFRPQVQRLSRLLDQDLSHWLEKPEATEADPE